MEHFDFLSTVKSGTVPDVRYLLLDTVEGNECFGHWMIECALFLPYWGALQAHSKVPLKILLSSPRRFKKVVLTDFGVPESDIVYSSKTQHLGGGWQRTHVVPELEEYEAYRPNYTFCWDTSTESRSYFQHIQAFKNFYYKEPIEKTIDVLFLKRSSKENYARNARFFSNLEEIVETVKAKRYAILDVDTLDSLHPQIDLVRRAKILIMEMGSAFTINAGWFASNSQIIVLNDFWNFFTCPYNFMKILRHQLKQNNNQVVQVPIVGHERNFSITPEVLITTIERYQFARSSCVICGKGDLEVLASFPRFPTMAVANDSCTAEFYDKQVDYCLSCGAFQLHNLVDPTILYSSVYTNATFSTIWKHHHATFCDFILHNSVGGDYLEIGANAGDLYRLLSAKRAVNYTVLDMFRHSDLPEGIHFIQGACEKFDYRDVQTVILSHVFEHLYEPALLLERLATAGVKTVYLSVPHFDKLLESKSLTILNSQHTYYCGKSHMDYLFSRFHYSCETYLEYEGGVASHMCKYVLSTPLVARPIPCREPVKSLYLDRIAELRRFEAPPNSFLMPSGIYGQYVYYFISNKSNILGFLDNNKARSGHTLYGTDKKVYHPADVDLTTATVLLCDCPYAEEITSGLKALCATISIRRIEIA